MNQNQFLNLPPVTAFLKMISNFTDFQGRTSREDFWWAFLANMIISAVVGVITGLLGVIGSLLAALVSLALLVPTLALWVRRLHDTGKSALWLLLALTGLGTVVLIIFAILEGDQGDNQYGPNPKSGFGY